MGTQVSLSITDSGFETASIASGASFASQWNKVASSIYTYTSFSKQMYVLPVIIGYIVKVIY